MVILKRIAMRPIGSDEPTAPLKPRNYPEVRCDMEDKRQVLKHAALLQRLGFSSPQIRRLMSNHPVLKQRGMAG
jgi:hypothetical protein